jgi:hypothetical protein
MISVHAQLNIKKNNKKCCRIVPMWWMMERESLEGKNHQSIDGVREMTKHRAQLTVN